MGGTTGGTGSGAGSANRPDFGGSTGGQGSSAGGGAQAGGSTGGAQAGGSAGGDAEANRLGGIGGGSLQDTLGQLEERADQVLDQAAEQLENVAHRIDDLADRVPDKGMGARAGTLGHSAADAIEALARFFRDNDVDTLERDLGRIVAQRPVTTVAAAAVAGFVVGKVLR
ncbi:MAG TPA: hypothetical protein VF625_10245 [Longimicrobium sp.]